MSSNSLGKIFTFTTWGESHGKAIGCVVDGVPSKIPLKKRTFNHFLIKEDPDSQNILPKEKKKMK